MFDFLPKELIPQAEIDAIRAKVWGLVSARQLTRVAPKTLHHYTDAAGLKGIVESGVMRASHLAYMNDASEYLHAVSLLLERESHPGFCSKVPTGFAGQARDIDRVLNRGGRQTHISRRIRWRTVKSAKFRIG
jgi:hypothetical protein